jgi:hypothetical protein
MFHSSVRADGNIVGRCAVGITCSNAHPEIKARLCRFLEGQGKKITVVPRIGCEQRIVSGPTRGRGSGPAPSDPLQRRRGGLFQSSPRSRRRRDHAEQLGLVAHCVDISDRLPTISKHHRHIGQHPATIVNRVNDRLCIALESSLVRPVRSASSRSATLPAWATTPDPSAATDNPADHEARFTYGVPSTWGFLDCRKNKNPKQDRHFRASARRSTPNVVNDPG